MSALSIHSYYSLQTALPIDRVKSTKDVVNEILKSDVATAFRQQTGYMDQVEHADRPGKRTGERAHAHVGSISLAPRDVSNHNLQLWSEAYNY